jgi:hypothetical protein
MSVAGISSSSLTQSTLQLPTLGRQQKEDAWRQLEQGLQSGDQAAAQQAYTTLAASGPNNSGPFSNPTRAAEFQSLGQSIEAGDLAGAQQQAGQLGSQQLAADSKLYAKDVQSGNPAAGQALANLKGDFWAVTGQEFGVSTIPQDPAASSASQTASAVNLQA